MVCRSMSMFSVLVSGEQVIDTIKGLNVSFETSLELP